MYRFVKERKKIIIYINFMVLKFENVFLYLKYVIYVYDFYIKKKIIKINNIIL